MVHRLPIAVDAGGELQWGIRTGWRTLAATHAGRNGKYTELFEGHG
jgi:hypothetical protein